MSESGNHVDAEFLKSPGSAQIRKGWESLATTELCQVEMGKI